MQILITNIGNRNIKYQGKVYSDLEWQGDRPSTKLSFRDWTKQLWDNFETEKDYIELNILDVVLNQEDFKPNKVFIVVSNQENNPGFNGQDTLHEGEIIRHLIRSKYYIDDIEIKEIKEDVTNDNYLMQFYQQFYAGLLHEYKDAYFIFCDAGGTGQQKTASKIMAEFMLPDNQWGIVYPKKDGSIEKKSQIEYRNIINKEQAIALVRKSQYEAALTILGGNVNDFGKNDLVHLLVYSHYRINRRIPEWIKGKDYIKNYFVKLDNDFIKSGFESICQSYSEDLHAVFKEKKYLDLSESLFIAYRKFNIGNYRDSILEFSVFYERFMKESLVLIEKRLKGTYTKPEDKQHIPTLQCWIEEKENALQTKEYLIKECERLKENGLEYKVDIKDIPTKIHFIAEQNFISDLQPLANVLLPYLDFTFFPILKAKQNSVREVRNKLAHEGKYIDKTILNTELPYYEQLLKDCLIAWGLPLEDIYAQLNKMIEEQIRNY